MDLFGFFKGLFIPSDRENRQNGNARSHFLKTDEQIPSAGIPNYGTETEDPMGFHIFSNPLEMHRYFEKQMHDMLKTFGFQKEDSFFGFNEGNSVGAPFSNYIEEPEPYSSGTCLRDQFLKPGFQDRGFETKERSDTDLDGQIQSNDFDSMFKENKVMTPYQPQTKFRSFGQSISSKTIRNSDGSVETHRTMKDSEGNQETVVTRRWGDKEYSVTTKSDKAGKQVLMENLTNLDEKDLQEFLKGGIISPDVPKNPQNSFPFNKYFK